MQHYFGLLSYGDGHNSLNRQERGQDAAPAPIEPKLESTAVAKCLIDKEKWSGRMDLNYRPPGPEPES